MEDWTALASLGLSIMFVALLISFYNVLIGPDGKGPQQQILPFPIQMQIMSISGVPAIIMAGIDYFLAKNSDAKRVGIILVAAGVIMVVGMIFAASMIPKIEREFLVEVIAAIPHVFAVSGAAIAAIGALLIIRTRGMTSYSKYEGGLGPT